MGRSRGGLTTKLHAVVDANGLPIVLKLTEGQARDGPPAHDMLAAMGKGQILLADRAYDSNALRESLAARGAWANIKPKGNRTQTLAFSAFLYKERNLVERLGGMVKAAVKRGQIDPAQQRHLNDYRATVTQHALVLLKPRVGQSSKADKQIRASVQMMHATAIDALHQDGGVLRRGRKRTADALSVMMLSYLDLPLGSLAKAHATTGEDDLIDSRLVIQLTRNGLKLFRSGREFAAFLGLVPRQNSSGGKDRLGRISKMGDRYLRKLLVVGATSVIRRARTGTLAAAPWIRSLLERRPARVVTVAMANKTARIVWAVLARGDVYRAPVMA